MKQHAPAPAASSRGLDRDAIARAAGLAPAQVRVVESIASTNAELLDRAPELNALAPAVLIARSQHAGRGRRGRIWITDPDACLAMSVCVHRMRGPGAPALTGLPLALGAAIAVRLAPRVPGLALKWPNDLLRDTRKCAGMLVETRAVGELDRVVIGLGLNWCKPASVAGELGQPVDGLFDALPPQALRESLAGELAGELIGCAKRFFDVGFSDTAIRWARFDGLAGREIVVAGAGKSLLQGVAAGIDALGALRVRTAEGIVSVGAGEVSVRALVDGEGQGPRG